MADKRLIEAAFPLSEASAASLHEKTMRHGHIATIHLWPARRPLAASRAAIVSALLPDPGDDETRTKLVRRLGGGLKAKKKSKAEAGKKMDATKVEGDGGILWWGQESLPDTVWFREQIQQAYGGRRPRVLDPFAGGGAIPLEAMRLGCEVTANDLNPVAWFTLKCTLDYPQRLAGQTLPLPPHAMRDKGFATEFLKAQGLKGGRLLEAVTRMTASGRGESLGGDLLTDVGGPWERAKLGWHVRAWGLWVLREARRDLASKYPVYADWQSLDGTEPAEARPPRLLPSDIELEDAVSALNSSIGAANLRNPETPRWVAKPTVAYLWARTVSCKSCRATTPLLKTRWLCKTDSRRVVLEMAPNAARDGVVFSVRDNVAEPTGNPAQRRAAIKMLGGGTMSRAGVTCPCCSSMMTMDDLRYEGKMKRLGAIMTAVAVDGLSGKEFRLPTEQELESAKITAQEIEDKYREIPFGVPRDPLPKKEAPGIRLPLYGFEYWCDLFNPRQLLALGEIVKRVRELPSVLKNHGYSSDWLKGIQAFNICGLSRLLDFMNTGVQWKIDVPTINHSFARFALPITWDFAEANALGDRAGSYSLCVDRVATGVDTLDRWEVDSRGTNIRCGSAMEIEGEYDAIITDPPYYDAIPYSDIMDFFYVWLRRCLFGMSPEMDAAFAESLGPKWDHASGDGELIDDASRFGGDKEASKKNFENGMASVFRRCHASLTPNGIMVIVFANKNPDAWETLVGGLIRAGFVVDGSLPIQTEQSSRMRAISSAALSSSVWLVCRKRPSTARPGFAVPVLTEMREKIRTQMHRFWDAGIRGPDFVWAATGPALEAYSRHPVVRRETSTTGEPEPLPVAEFLREVRRLVVEFAVGRVLKPSDKDPEVAGGLDDITTYYVLHRDSFGLEEAPIGACILYALSCGLSDADLADRFEILARTGGNSAVDDVEIEEDEGTDDGDVPESEGSGSKVRLRRWDQRRRKTLGLEGVGGLPVPLIDRAHRLMQLWKSGDVAKVNAFIEQAGLARDTLFAQLIQALIELANRDGKGDEAPILRIDQQPFAVPRGNFILCTAPSALIPGRTILSSVTVKPWPEIVRVRDDVRTGALSLQEFAADLFDVINRTGKRPIYENPEKFFSLSYATGAQRDIAAATAERLRGKSQKAVRQLELTYGGGKTHTLVTLTHLFRDPALLPNLPAAQEFKTAMGGEPPKARVAAVCFDKLDIEAGVPAIGPTGEERLLKYPWSIIAFQLAGADGLRAIHAEGKDAERESPPRDLLLEKVLEMPSKEGLATLILFDEVLMYAGEKAKDPTGGQLFREQFLNFLQSLSQAVSKVNTASMIVSLLASDPKRDDAFGRGLLSDMANILGRKEDEPFMPVGKDDVAEILRRRLLDPETTKDPNAFKPNVQAVVKALTALDPEFAKTLKQREVREKQYLASFPFDPAMMEVFYTRWTSGLPLFQRTRGVLRTFAVALRDAESCDKAPLAGASILLGKDDDSKLSSALSDLAGVARLDGVDGKPMDWVAILQGELRFAREAQEQLPALVNREIEQAVIGTFLHSQPQGTNHARIADLYAFSGAAKPDRIALEKGMQSWAERSWFLDEVHLESAEKRLDGSRGLPKTWRLGFQPNLKQMHDEAKVNRVSKSGVDEMLLDEIKAAKWLDSGATALGAKVHKLPTGPEQVPSDGEFRYVILGPNGQSESGKPSGLAVRFCDEVTGPQNPRTAKNAIVIAAPDRSGIALAQDKVRDHLAWLEVKSLLTGQTIDPVRSSKLDTEVTGSKKDIAGAVRQAYSIVITRGADDVVHAFKVTVDTAKPLFQTIKEDPKSRITDIPLAPDAIVPGSTSGFDLWRDDEERRRVKTIIGAFAERPKLPKMLRRKDLLDTVANGCALGLYVLSLPRPDGTARTWWRMRPEDAVVDEDALETVQNSAATLESLDPSLLVPDKLESLDWKTGLKMADLVTYFSGSKITIDHPDEGWTEERDIPKCPESKILEAVGAAVKVGTVWITSGTASIWGETPPAGIVNKTAVLRAPPEPISVSSITPEVLPDAWSDAKASVHSIEQAVAAQRGVVSLPWKLVETVITGALNSGFIRVLPGAASWPCQPHEAPAVQIGLPETPTTKGETKSPGFAEGPKSWSKPKAPFREAVLDSSQLTELLESMGDVLAAAGNLTLRFKVAVDFAEGEVATSDVAAKLGAALDKLGLAAA